MAHRGISGALMQCRSARRDVFTLLLMSVAFAGPAQPALRVRLISVVVAILLGNRSPSSCVCAATGRLIDEVRKFVEGCGQRGRMRRWRAGNQRYRYIGPDEVLAPGVA